jgi:hypothetical protein
VPNITTPPQIETRIFLEKLVDAALDIDMDAGDHREKRRELGIGKRLPRRDPVACPNAGVTTLV